MHWGRIDFLPVVELFQSLLAGTGSAVFELIRGLYDDQNTGESPRVLRYRGIPTYPSPQAFRLFSTYFVPEAKHAADPFSVFMDPARSAEVAWRPRSDPPHRFMDEEHALCVTVAASIYKVTKGTDPTALPYMRPTTQSAAAEDRLVGVTKGALVLQNGEPSRDHSSQTRMGHLKGVSPSGDSCASANMARLSRKAPQGGRGTGLLRSSTVSRQ